MNDGPEWSPPLTHNEPPLDLAEALEPQALDAYLARVFQKHQARLDELIAAQDRFLTAVAKGIHDDALAGKATDYVRQIKTAETEADDCRVAIKAPVLHASRQIDAYAKRITEPLGSFARVAEGKVREYLTEKEEAARKVAAEHAKALAEQAKEQIAEGADPADIDATVKAAEQAHVAAHATPAELSRTHSNLGGVASLRQNWTYRIVDKAKLIWAVSAGKASADLLLPNDQMLKALAKSQKDKAEVPGVEFFNNAGVTIR